MSDYSSSSKLEAIHLAFHPLENLFNFQADVFWIHKQVIVYTEILLLCNLHHQKLLKVETMAFPDMVVVMLWQVIVTIKLTVIYPQGIKMLITRGQVN